MNHSSVESWLTSAASQRIGEFTTQLRGVSDTSASVPNLEWTVADLAQHLASMASHFQRLQDDGADFVRPTDWAAFTNERRAHITETDPAKLADLIEVELGGYVRVLAASTSRWLYGKEVSPTTMTALLLNEAVMHGRDLAGVTGAKRPTLDTAEAHAAAEAAMATTSIFIDPTKAAAQPDGIYHIKFRRGKDFTWSKEGSELIVHEGKPAKADAHLNTDPAMFMLSSLGRVSQVRAALSGKMVSYGRKPWRFLGLGKIVVDGV